LGALMLLGGHSPAVHAKPVKMTSLAEGIERAPVIVVAELVRHQFESIPEGRSATVTPYSIWREFKVSRVLKNAAKVESLNPGTVLRITDRSNSCIAYETKITRNADTLHMVTPGRRPPEERRSLRRFTKDYGKRVFLFLEPSGSKQITRIPPRLGHFGWGLSPADWSAETQRDIRTRVVKATAGGRAR
jgi:hypothetical protein